MALRTLRIWPDESLTTPTQAVGRIDADIRSLIADLFDTMHAERGIGLAANQVGINLSVVVVDLDADGAATTDRELRRELASWGYTGPLALINPKIVRRAGDITWEEGCLSVPGILGKVTRSARIEVAYHDAQGRKRTLEAKDLFAVCIQHELDHLAGRVFVEYLPQNAQAAARRSLMRKAG